MKFEKGFQELQPDTTASYPLTIVDVRTEPGALIDRKSVV